MTDHRPIEVTCHHQGQGDLADLPAETLTIGTWIEGPDGRWIVQLDARDRTIYHGGRVTHLKSRRLVAGAIAYYRDQPEILATIPTQSVTLICTTCGREYRLGDKVALEEKLATASSLGVNSVEARNITG